jgi:hypothetical protein
MAITNFIPNVWSETLARELDGEYIAVKNSNRDFEGEIKKAGDVVKINSLGPVSVFSYTKNTDLTSPQTLDGTQKTLTISQAKAFNFQIDDVDRAQSAPKLMSGAMRNAANALSDEADRYVFGLYTGIDADHTITNAAFDYNAALDTILDARERLLEAGVNSNVKTVLEVSPAVGAQILKAKLLVSPLNEEAVENGYIGDYLGFKVYISPNVYKDGAGNYKCYARTTRAIAYAEQLSEIEAYRPEKRFADAVKGLHLYGGAIIFPNEILLLNLRTV